MNRLAEIVEQKRKRLAASASVLPIDAVKAEAQRSRDAMRPHALRKALVDADQINIIAEFKRRSPSKGIIRSDADPKLIAAQYESGGAVAVSVLTEEDYFDGSLNDLRAVRQTIALPILRKDFILDEYQVYESAAAGADALLLIVASLNDDVLRHLRSITEDDLEMDALVEVHNAEEMRRAIDCGAKLIGVNNRNLATFEVSLQTSIELAVLAPAGSVLISESGIETVADIERLREAGCRGFLIGETLMKAESPGELLKEFTRKREGAKTNA
jgi:indole-3-glycerol phosphate synthase